MNNIRIYKSEPDFVNVGKYFSKPEYIKKIHDASMRELREHTKSKQKTQNERAKFISGIRYDGLNSYGDLKFSCNSQDGTKRYNQLVRFYDLLDRIPTSRDEILDMMLNSDVGVDCTDPSFQYWGGAYNATRYKFNIRVENRGLNEPNKAKKEQFFLCKHLLQVLTAVPFYWNNIVSDFIKFFDMKTTSEEEKEEELTVQEAEDLLNEEEVLEEPNDTSTESEEQ